jgi:hypothetical protein
MHSARKRLQRKGWGYDIREIPEDLYQAVLACRRAESRCSAADPASDATATEPPATASSRQQMG